MTMENGPFLKMYFLLKMVIFQLAMLVFRGVLEPRSYVVENALKISKPVGIFVFKVSMCFSYMKFMQH